MNGTRLTTGEIGLAVLGNSSMGGIASMGV